jgi:hypothetical protein
MTATLHHGILRAFDSGTYKARVTLKGSIHMSLADVPTSRTIATGEMIAGRNVAVLIFDETKATDAVVIAVYT